MKKVQTTLITAAVLTALCGSAQATTIDPLSWELMILQADMVAVVQCETAGGILARYKVKRSWRGPAAGKKVSIRVAVNYWEPQFPVTRCGQRFFVTGYRSPPGTMVSTTSGGGVPLWWRDIRDDFRLPLFQGRLELSGDPKQTIDLGKLGKLKGEAALDQTIKKVLARNPKQMEARLLYLHTRRAFFRSRLRYKKDWADYAKLKGRLERARTAQQVLALLAAVVRAHPDDVRYGLRRALASAGGKIALKALESKPWTKLPRNVLDRAAMVAAIKGRLAGKAPRRRPPPGPSKAPSKIEMTKLRQALAGGQRGRDFGKALTVLSKYDPATVASYLRAWKPTGKHWGAKTQGYTMGSYFAWRCGADRKKHFATLIKAKDPYIRVAGAVYLTMEDRKTGMKALRRMAKLPGDPGAWAALNLARRGDKAAVPRALKLFAQQVSPGGMGGVPHRNLQKRLLVLFSNAACKAGVPQPLAANTRPADPYKVLLAWWKQHKTKLALKDPWLKVLEKQKMD